MERLGLYGCSHSPDQGRGMSSGMGAPSGHSQDHF